MSLIEEGDLGAAVSRIEPPDLTRNMTPVLAYAKVVEALHADRTVLPMRYGCVFEEEPQVVELIRVHGEEYGAVLRGLDGCVEMGVRVLPPTGSPSRCSPIPPQIRGASGRAYLAARAARYAREEAADRAVAAVAERLRGALDGLAERIETDRAVRTDRALSSLYFLVKRGAVEPFRLAFRHIERAEAARLLLSGPWPPYNFATPPRPGQGHG
ncbi:MAG: GvpL/GvpF family gas vesicle protein [Deltaproteobacteria bacterium]|nr:GvpL/GvpF family gas vesicle protein [Deltaproteobacteria bacterium]